MTDAFRFLTPNMLQRYRSKQACLQDSPRLSADSKARGLLPTFSRMAPRQDAVQLGSNYSSEIKPNEGEHLLIVQEPQTPKTRERAARGPSPTEVEPSCLVQWHGEASCTQQHLCQILSYMIVCHVTTYF
jgi:hypothetical protein